MPTCSRCIATSAECAYVESRRGYRGPKRKHVGQSPHGDAVTSASPNFTFNLLQTLQAPSPTSPLSFTDDTISIDRDSNNEDDSADLFDLYYHFFHAAHPIVIPRRIFLQNYGVLPKHLRQAMKVIGYQFLKMGQQSHLTQAKEILCMPIPDDVFKVQSLLILAIASFARFEREEGGDLLKRAVDVAQKIGLNSANFGEREQPLFRESYRRTWWELYTIVGIVSLIMPFGLKLDIAWSLPLPCHCEEYNNGQTSLTKTPQEMLDRFLAEGSFSWSSFAYKVEAVRILVNIIDLSNDLFVSQSQVDAAATSIASFWMSLPVNKREVICRSGKTDEVLFCAHMLISLGSICLHLPRSGMPGIRHFKTICATNRAGIVAENAASHKSAAIKAASKLARLMSTGDATKSHTPCFSCAIAFATAVQLPAYLEEDELSEMQLYKEQIQLAVSMLQEISEIWPIASVVRTQIAQYAREVMGSSLPALNRSLRLESAPTVTDAILGNQEWLHNLLQGADSGMEALIFQSESELLT
ncbi:hypothetical protein INT43_002153 [Umbelopsis isabellina]|uniref:Xylanolytic transcriptional activator regulatory domain-containing protein n=1 Tax=Mortierella isabellina TaxID=91625 RepID=A0A8H7Q4H3_MORIS|nr:hypothetical protein INT43_002153 [Umbelopsis isabellina]